MDKRREDFHGSVFATLSQSESENIAQIDFRNGQPSIGDSIRRWHLSNTEKTSGVIIDSGKIHFHTTAYRNSTQFFAEFRELISAFVMVLPDEGVVVTRLGLRYVDLLLPEPGLTVDGQVIESLRVPRLPDIGEMNRTNQSILYNTQVGGTLVVRHRQSMTSDLLPPDLFPNKLRPAPRLETNPPANSVVGILDFDHFIEVQDQFEIEQIINKFRDLHRVSSNAFKATTTKEALHKWTEGVVHE